MSDDEAIAVMLKSSIERIFLNSEVFVSGRDLKGGDVWASEIKAKLNKSSVIIALITDLSLNSNWVMFEAGSGFVENKTIPLCVPSITVDDLTPPLSLLQSRNYSEKGIKNLLHDIAKIADLRVPQNIHGIPEEIAEVEEYLSLRKSSNMEPQASKNTKKQQDNKATDHDITKKLQQVEDNLKKYIVSQLLTVDSSSYEIPPKVDLAKMDLGDLGELAEYANVPFDRFIITRIVCEKIDIPRIDAPMWKKINKLKGIELLSKDVAKYIDPSS